MLDYQRIVDDVRSALFNNAQEGDEMLQAAVADYSLAIDEVNERLRGCGALLRKGLRCEAIQLCEVEPNLLDTVELLDFPERETWHELLAMRGLAAPAKLMLDVAENLNDAYTIERPLAKLMQRHRLLALGRGPMKSRVETLRQLAEADHDNRIWEQDLREFEEERIRELQREVPEAISNNDSTALNALAEEMEKSRWRVGRPEALIRQIANARAHVAQLRGLAELRRAADKLDAMHAAFDIEGGRRARGEWQRLHGQWGRYADSALLNRTAPALDWLREQDELAAKEMRHETAIADLEQALAGQRPRDELHRLYRALKQEGEVPPGLERQYRQRLEEIKRAARSQRLAAVAIFATFLAITGAVVGFFVYQQHQAGRTDRALATLQQYERDKNVDEARNFIDQLTAESPQIAADPRIQEINSRLKKLQKEEDTRRQTFANALEAVQKSIADGLLDKDALTRARSLARAEDEKSQVRNTEREIARLDREKQSKVDQDFLAELAKLKEKIDEAEKLIGANPVSAIDRLRQHTAELTSLQNSHSQVGDSAKAEAEEMQKRLKKLIELAGQGNEELSAEAAIVGACGDHAAFRQKLLDFAEKFPGARQSASFRAVANDEMPLWDWIGQWNETVRTVGRGRISGFNAKAAADAAAKIRKLLADRAGHPEAEDFKRRLPYLDAIVRRVDASGNPIEAALRPVFNNPLISGAWMLTDPEGRRYYLLEDPAAKFGATGALQPSRTYGFEYVTGIDLSKKRKTLRGSEIDVNRLIAPQRATAKALLSSLDTATDEQWEPAFRGMIETVLKDKETDPLLRQFLLRSIITVGCQGSVCLQKGLAGYADALQKSKVPTTVNWIDPNDSEAAAMRPTAEAELGSLPDLDKVRQVVDKELQGLNAPVGTEVTCIGWLRKDPSGAWQCLTKANCPESGYLVIVRFADSQKGAARLEQIGSLDKFKAIVKAASGPALAEGRPVFACPTAKQRTARP